MQSYGLTGAPPNVVTAKIRPPRVFAWERRHLSEQLSQAWKVPLTLVVAPAGSGKTTALAQFAEAAPGSGRLAAWHVAERADGQASAVLRHLDAAVARACSMSARGWATVEDAAETLDLWSGPDIALIVDDLHALEGTPGEAALEQLIRYLPPAVHVIGASRRTPAFNLSRLRVSEQLIEVGPDDLRFRAWEADRLFRDHYCDPIPADELSELLRRTDGWAAGLRMFRLATQGKSAAERRRTLAMLSSRLHHLRDYVDCNVFDGLDAELRTFLVRTSVLGRLTAAWCDELLDGEGSDRLLEEIERRHRFLAVDSRQASYRCSETLRGRLEEMLAEELGAVEARELHRRAARILETGRAFPEALRAYCRAEDWDGAQALLARSGAGFFGSLAGWVHALRPSLPDYPAWTLLAKARREVVGGYWFAAEETYRRAEEAFGGCSTAKALRHERVGLSSWLDPSAPPPPDWNGRLRQSLRRYRADAHEDATDPSDALVAGLSAICSGWFNQGIQQLASVADRDGVSPAVGGYAHLGAAAAGMVIGRLRVEAVAAASEAVESLAPLWLGRLVVTLASGQADAARLALHAARQAAEEASNPWAAAGVALAEGIVLLLAGEVPHAAAVLRDAGHQFDALGAPVLTAWGNAFESLALGVADRELGRAQATLAVEAAEVAGCSGALALALRVAVATGAEKSMLTRALSLEREGVIDLGGLVARVLGTSIDDGPAPSVAPSGVDVRCFGEFALTIGGRRVDCCQVKPRARSLLQILAVHAGQFIHRDELLAALWPDDDLQSGLRNLQVAMSSLRRLLEPGAPRGQAALIVREGDSYRLTIDTGSDDVGMFEQAVQLGRKAAEAGDAVNAVAHLRDALALYTGELLPEAGSAEWIVGPRERHRVVAGSTAQLLADSLLALGEVEEATAACERGLQIDRYHDGLWRTLIASRERAEDRLAAARARHRYEEVLTELDVPLTSPAS